MTAETPSPLPPPLPLQERLKLNLRTSTNFQVFEIEEDLSQRETELIRSELDYQLAILELVRVTGVRLSELMNPERDEKLKGILDGFVRTFA